MDASERDEILLEASYLVAQATAHLDTITRTETLRLDERYADRVNKPSYTRRKFTLKDAKAEADAAARYLRQAWDLLDPPLRR